MDARTLSLVVPLLVATMLSASTAPAATYVVRPDGTGDFPTIQAAVHGVDNGDVIELTDGTFLGDGNRDIDYMGKAVTIRSQSGNPELCVIDCEASATYPHRGFYFRVNETAKSVLEGVTICNGIAAPAGGAILLKSASAPTISSCIFSQNGWSAVYCINGSSPTFTDCLFTQNDGHRGGAIDCTEASLTVIDCDFVDNAATYIGGAISCSNAQAEIAGCSFVQNTAPSTAAIDFSNDSQASLVDCLFADNSASSISGAVTLFLACEGTIERCTFVNNSCGGAGGALLSGKISNTLVKDCTFWGNSGQQGTIVAGHEQVVFENTIIAFNHVGPAIASYFDYAQLTCCDIYGNAGGDWVGNIAGQFGINGNISEDPLFCDPANEDFTLHADSPCAPFSPPNQECDLIGACPVGCTSTPATGATWGTIKASFR